MLTWFNTFLVLFLIELVWFLLFVVSIQPAKLYTINLLVNNTEAEDIVLAPSDSQPANGFVLKGQTCKRLVKRLRIPSPVNFRVWGITTNKPFLLNGQREISITPSDYEQDLTEVSIKMVKPGGEFIMVICNGDNHLTCILSWTHVCCGTVCLSCILLMKHVIKTTPVWRNTLLITLTVQWAQQASPDILAIILWLIVRFKRIWVSSLFGSKVNDHGFRTFYIAK